MPSPSTAITPSPLSRIYQFIGPINQNDTPQFGELFAYYQNISGVCVCVCMCVSGVFDV